MNRFDMLDNDRVDVPLRFLRAERAPLGPDISASVNLCREYRSGEMQCNVDSENHQSKFFLQMAAPMYLSDCASDLTKGISSTRHDPWS